MGVLHTWISPDAPPIHAAGVSFVQSTARGSIALLEPSTEASNGIQPTRHYASDAALTCCLLSVMGKGTRRAIALTVAAALAHSRSSMSRSCSDRPERRLTMLPITGETGPSSFVGMRAG